MIRIFILDKKNWTEAEIFILNPKRQPDIQIHNIHNQSLALELIRTERQPFIILTEGFSDSGVIDCIHQLRAVSRKAIIIVRADLSPDEWIQAMEAGADEAIAETESYRLGHSLKRFLLRLREQEEKRELLEQLEDSFRELQFQKFALDQSAIVSISDEKGIISYVNDKFLQISGYSREEILGHTHKLVNSGTHSNNFWEQMYKTIRSGSVWKGEVCNTNKSGEIFWVDLTIVPFMNADGKPYKYVSIQFDITYRILAEQQLTHDAFYDPLTDLPNRNLLLARIESTISEISSKQENRIAVAILNLDRFKRINSSMGYQAGDKLIIQFAQFLKTINDDSIGGLARLSADNFAVLFRSEDLDPGFILEKLQDWKTYLEKPLTIEGVDIYITFSSGICFRSEGSDDGETMLKNAEVALARAKRHGISSNFLFRPEDLAFVQSQVHIHNEMKRGIQNQEFYPFFQPIVNLSDLSLAGWESLVRWIKPDGTVISPYYFLQEAEETGLITQISELVHYRSFEFLKKVRNVYPEGEALFISINLSSKQFQDLKLVEKLEKFLFLAGLRAENVHLEITESIAMENFQNTMELLSRLRSSNFHLSLDDFGTGYSSFAYLKEFPLTNLKIDKAFIDSAHKKQKDKSLLATIIQLGRSLELDTIGEGVESVEQVHLLRALGCGHGQGYYFSKPLPETESFRFLENCKIENKKIIVNSFS
jgi:diguanylate cyclase (GGDEF)-like protein/PAS domain S-box-containing protein